MKTELIKGEDMTGLPSGNASSFTGVRIFGLLLFLWSCCLCYIELSYVEHEFFEHQHSGNGRFHRHLSQDYSRSREAYHAIPLKSHRGVYANNHTHISDPSVQKLDVPLFIPEYIEKDLERSLAKWRHTVHKSTHMPFAKIGVLKEAVTKTNGPDRANCRLKHHRKHQKPVFHTNGRVTDMMFRPQRAIDNSDSRAEKQMGHNHSNKRLKRSGWPDVAVTLYPNIKTLYFEFKTEDGVQNQHPYLPQRPSADMTAPPLDNKNHIHTRTAYPQRLVSTHREGFPESFDELHIAAPLLSHSNDDQTEYKNHLGRFPPLEDATHNTNYCMDLKKTVDNAHPMGIQSKHIYSGKHRSHAFGTWKLVAIMLFFIVDLVWVGTALFLMLGPLIHNNRMRLARTICLWSATIVLGGSVTFVTITNTYMNRYERLIIILHTISIMMLVIMKKYTVELVTEDGIANQIDGTKWETNPIKKDSTFNDHLGELV